MKPEDAVDARHVRAVRVGHGANCSSIGSVVDTLFVAAAVSGAMLAVILAAMKEEKVTVVGGEDEDAEEQEEDRPA